MITLGVNAYHGDSSACILVDGKLIAAAEEERFRRIKHWAGFPSEAIKYCLNEVAAKPGDIDHVSVNRDPNTHLLRKALFTFKNRPSINLIIDRFKNANKVRDTKTKLAEELGIDYSKLKCGVSHVEHHMAHLGSSFFVSPFDNAVVVSVDGFGDFVGAMWGIGNGSTIQVKERIFFPHSLGLYYLALTQFLGFPKYGDEYKVMGLASFGEPFELDKMRKVVQLNSKGQFQLDLKYFVHHTGGVSMTWKDGEPQMGQAYSRELEKLLGPSRSSNEPISDRHKGIAASLQSMYEEAFFSLLNYIYKQTKNPVLCLAGGCAMNSVANGKIFERTPFKEVYIQAAAGDAGGAIGAAFYTWHQLMQKPRDFIMKHAYWGPQFNDSEISEVLSKSNVRSHNQNCKITEVENEEELCLKTAKEISDGKVIGWFQGRMEWGSRALGNRSILADPRRTDMKDILNKRIKHREPFRPFAPSILEEFVGDYFEEIYPDPFMMKVYPVREKKRAIIPAVTHVDGTGRLQTVNRQENPLYWKLIKEFEKLTGIPILLNTSFNENEPIVCNPEEALECFKRTNMDVLVMGKFFIQKV